MCQWHMFSTDRSGNVGVRSTEQSLGIKVGGFSPRHHNHNVAEYRDVA